MKVSAWRFTENGVLFNQEDYRLIVFPGFEADFREQNERKLRTSFALALCSIGSFSRHLSLSAILIVKRSWNYIDAQSACDAPIMLRLLLCIIEIYSVLQ
jgi:hypothetical protein